MEAYGQLGYWGLFTASFLAATILPFSSEVILSAMLTNGFDAFSLLVCASAGNILGSVVNYGIGILGIRLIQEKFLRMSSAEMDRSVARFKRYGTVSLLFAWVPVIGDPLTVAAGVLRINFSLFLVLVGTGKLLRYAAIITIVSLL